MQSRREAARRDSSGPVGGRPFAWRSFLGWLSALLVLSVLVGWAAAVAEEKFAPLIIFPLLVGVGLGALIVALVRLAQVGSRPTALWGTVLAVALTVIAQHYVRYRTERHRVQRQVETLLHGQLPHPELLEAYLPSPPANLLGYLQAEAKRGRDMKVCGYVARGWVAWLTWAIDGLLVLAAALAMVVPAMRLPFCDRCGSWYRITRSGRIDALTAGRLAELVDVRPEEPPTSARYRLLSCNGGCGLTDFELSWQHSRGAASFVQAWLDSERRDRVTHVLDEARAKNAKQDIVPKGQDAESGT
jgi:hypothetical protein